MNIDKMLNEEIADGIVALGKMQKGSQEYGDLVGDLTKLIDRAIEMERLDNDIVNKDETRELEAERVKLEAERLKLDLERLKNEIRNLDEAREDERKDRLIKNCLTGVSIGTSAALFIWGAMYAWHWERTDTLTSTPGKEIVKAMFRLKKL